MKNVQKTNKLVDKDEQFVFHVVFGRHTEQFCSLPRHVTRGGFSMEVDADSTGSTNSKGGHDDVIEDIKRPERGNTTVEVAEPRGTTTNKCAPLTYSNVSEATGMLRNWRSRVALTVPMKECA